jgi:hypothetical protein
MLDIKSQSQLAEATAEMMRACAFATARAAGTSMLQGMSFWSRMLNLSAASPEPADAQVQEPSQPASAQPPADTAFASYRSSSGHAVAQVIVA